MDHLFGIFAFNDLNLGYYLTTLIPPFMVRLCRAGADTSGIQQLQIAFDVCGCSSRCIDLHWLPLLRIFTGSKLQPLGSAYVS